ncbi:MAG: GNAT family N-acetyltransferase [Pseudarcicella sp.]|nr:GNAT family N-acetyltransferase [Pseudarcicella sp.]MBP6410665.1 GNAT family N-acetyltransferase [Pseudarcicella sp.]
MIRKGKIEDIPKVYELIIELAIYEKALHQVTNTIEQLKIDGFGENPLFEFLIAENDEQEIVGMSLYYFRYSTWKGKRLYLEDLIVKENQRANGYGKMLLEATIQAAKDSKSTGLMWQVLDWNQPSIDFYKKFGATFDGEWLNVHLDLNP